MRIGIYDYNQFNNTNNQIFISGTNKIGENLEYPFIKLREELNSLGHSLDTLDMYPLREYEKIIFLDFPPHGTIDLPGLLQYNISLYLIILESPIVRPENWDLNNHKYFSKIFTWNKASVDNKKYYKINISHKLPDTCNFDHSNKDKLCTIIAGNKRGNEKRELYSERKKAINWFEKHHPTEFDLYGYGWDSFQFHGPRMVRALNRIKILPKMLAPKYKTYRGPVSSKLTTLEKYKFSICYENVSDVPDYITEKIFDCLFAGCVPVYLGAPNISDYVPKNCYVDRNDFSSYEDLYVFMNTMPDDIYGQYIDNIRQFLLGENIKVFSGEYFAKSIVKNLDLENQP